jgi:hypothetical protein
MIHIDFSVTRECKHPEWTYGEICVKCGECGRFDKDYVCINCGYTEGRKPFDVYRGWGFIEFYDVFASPICPKCKPLFKLEDKTNYKDTWEQVTKGKDMDCYIKDFKSRV